MYINKLYIILEKDLQGVKKCKNKAGEMKNCYDDKMPKKVSLCVYLLKSYIYIYVVSGKRRMIVINRLCIY